MVTLEYDPDGDDDTPSKLGWPGGNVEKCKDFVKLGGPGKLGNVGKFKDLIVLLVGEGDVEVTCYSEYEPVVTDCELYCMAVAAPVVTVVAAVPTPPGS